MLAWEVKLDKWLADFVKHVDGAGPARKRKMGEGEDTECLE